MPCCHDPRAEVGATARCAWRLSRDPGACSQEGMRRICPVTCGSCVPCLGSTAACHPHPRLRPVDAGTHNSTSTNFSITDSTWCSTYPRCALYSCCDRRSDRCHWPSTQQYVPPPKIRPRHARHPRTLSTQTKATLEHGLAALPFTTPSQFEQLATRAELRVLYLVQGKTASNLPKEYISFFKKPTRDFYFISFAATTAEASCPPSALSGKHRGNSQVCRLLRNHTVHFPRSTLGDGRNMMYLVSREQEMLQGWLYNYVVFLDDVRKNAYLSEHAPFVSRVDTMTLTTHKATDVRSPHSGRTKSLPSLSVPSARRPRKCSSRQRCDGGWRARVSHSSSTRRGEGFVGGMPWTRSSATLSAGCSLCSRRWAPCAGGTVCARYTNSLSALPVAPRPRSLLCVTDRASIAPLARQAVRHIGNAPFATPITNSSRGTARRSRHCGPYHFTRTMWARVAGGPRNWHRPSRSPSISETTCSIIQESFGCAARYLRRQEALILVDVSQRVTIRSKAAMRSTRNIRAIATTFGGYLAPLRESTKTSARSCRCTQSGIMQHLHASTGMPRAASSCKVSSRDPPGPSESRTTIGGCTVGTTYAASNGRAQPQRWRWSSIARQVKAAAAGRFT